MTKESFLLYKSFYDPIKDLSDEDAGKLFKSIYEYQINGKECPHSGMIKMAFQFFKNQFDLDNKKYETIVSRNKGNGKKGGRPKRGDIVDDSGTPLPGASNGVRYIYLLKDIVNEEYKIGETKDMKKRIYTINRPTNNLHVYFCVPVNEKDSLGIEKEFKRKFHSLKIKGDWFLLSNSDLGSAISYLKEITDGFILSKKIPKIPKKADNDNDNDNDNEKDKEKKTNYDNIHILEEDKLKKLEPLMNEQIRKESSSLVFIKKSFLRNDLSDLDENINLEGFFLADKRLLESVASVYTMTRKKVDDRRVYERWVKKALVGNSDKKCSIVEIIEDVNAYVDKRLREIIGYYSDIKQKDDEKRKVEQDKKQTEFALSVFESLSEDERNQIEITALDIVQRQIGVGGYKVKTNNRMVTSRIVKILKEKGYLDQKQEVYV